MNKNKKSSVYILTFPYDSERSLAHRPLPPIKGPLHVKTLSYDKNAPSVLTWPPFTPVSHRSRGGFLHALPHAPCAMHRFSRKYNATPATYMYEQHFPGNAPAFSLAMALLGSCMWPLVQKLVNTQYLGVAATIQRTVCVYFPTY